jgi:hypothetical protein
MSTTYATALAQLDNARTHVLSARVNTLAAAAHLSAARRTRAVELAERLADCLARADRLALFLRGDAAEAAEREPRGLGAIASFIDWQRRAAEAMAAEQQRLDVLAGREGAQR